MRDLQRYPNNSHFLRSCNSTGDACHWPLQRNLLSNFTFASNNKSINRTVYIVASSFAVHTSSERERASGLSFGQSFSLCAIMWRLLWLASLLVVSRSDISCDEATDKCTKDFTECGFALYKIFERRECSAALGFEKDEFVGYRISRAMAKTCPLTCVSAINNLTATNAGKAMETCNCERDSTCLTIKARLKRCVLSRNKNYTIFSCTKARKRCNANKDCKRTQFNFLRRCTKLISGVECTRDCRDSQDDLLNSDLGKALNECECDGLEETYCRGIRANYEELCFATRSPRNPGPSAFPVPTERTVKAVPHSGQNSVANSQFELPVWIFYAAIMAHVYMFFNL